MTFFPDTTREMKRKLFTISYALIQKDTSWSGIDLNTNRSLNLAIQSEFVHNHLHITKEDQNCLMWKALLKT